MRITLVLFAFLTSFCSLGKEVATFGAIVFPPHTTFDEKTKECVGDSIISTRHILRQYDIEMDVVCASAIRIYKLIESGDADITINVKSTNALKQNVTFIDIPYQSLSLALYSHESIASQRTISGIRGFDYHGQRERLLANGFEFVDLPNSLSALQVFIKRRSSHLISYQGPVEYYLKEFSEKLQEPLMVTPLLSVDTFYAISKKSHLATELKAAFDGYAEKHKINYFRKKPVVFP